MSRWFRGKGLEYSCPNAGGQSGLVQRKRGVTSPARNQISPPASGPGTPYARCLATKRSADPRWRHPYGRTSGVSEEPISPSPIYSGAVRANALRP